ncbi:ABC transporter permease [Kitasatospora sp. NPDC094028]
MNETLSDAWALTGRHMRHIKRMPERLLSLTVLPVAFVVVFGYLFGSAMSVPGGGSYQEYIMSGIFVQVMLGNVSLTALGVVADLENGLVDRFRSLPISRSAVLIGRTVSDLVLGAWTCLVMAVVGFLIGWRVHNGFFSTLGGFALLLMLGFGLSWIGALLGLALRSVEAVNALGAMIMMPLAFLSNAFIPLDGLPSWLRTIAEWNPVSAVVAASRSLFGNSLGTSSTAFPAQHPAPLAVGFTVILLAVAIPLAGRAYQKVAAR